MLLADIVTEKNQIGLLSWNLTNNKLMVFDACSTAVGSSNICTTAVQQGADAVLGWYDIISTESFDWLQRFYYRLGTGTSIQTAINYADSFNDYSSDSNLKKHTLFGNANQVLKKTRSGGILEDPREHPVEEFYIDFDNIDYTVIEKALRAEFPNFNIDDYKIRVSSTNPENTNFVIDFNEVVNGCWTSSGYTLIFIDNKTSIVYDNTIKSPSSTKQSIITHNATESEIINYKTEAAQKIPNGESVIRQYGENCLDISTGKTYYRVYTIFGPAGTKFKRIMTEDFYQ